jgi:DNA-binding NtrC family response regulator
MENGKVLIFGDDERENYKLANVVKGFCETVLCFKELETSLKYLYSEEVHLIIINTTNHSQNNINATQKFRSYHNNVQIVVILKKFSTQDIIDYIKEGAFDVIADLRDIDKFREIISKGIKASRSYSKKLTDPSSAFDSIETDSIIGQSAEMLEIYKSIGQVARSNATVLIEGESGTGKEIVAREIVRNSFRANSPFLAVNCASIPETLLESELFGYEKGAFTDAKTRKIGKFEQCNSGTLFLDEIGDMSSQLQGKVLRVLQEQSFERVGGNQTVRVDVRIIAATNKSLYQCSKAGSFRWDLYYRLKVFHIHLPRLRDRGNDIMLLANHFLKRYSLAMQKEIAGFARETMDILNAYHWPGNVRELDNTIQTAVVMSKGNLILPEYLPENLKGKAAVSMKFDNLEDDYEVLFDELINANFDNIIRKSQGNLYTHITSAVEANLIKRTLIKTSGNQVKAAKILGISRNTLRDRIEKFKIGEEISE